MTDDREDALRLLASIISGGLMDCGTIPVPSLKQLEQIAVRIMDAGFGRQSAAPETITPEQP